MQLYIIVAIILVMKLLVSALEPSANIHLESLINELGESVELMGIFDKKLGKSIVDLQSLSIMGFVDAIKKLRFFFALADEMLSLAGEADKVLLIDSSGFNLPLARKLKKRYPQKEIIYYILPQAWAWKRGRIKVLEATIDRLCSILPFEKNYYSKNAPIEYVGHPLLDQIKNFKSSTTSEIKRVLFMAGSRRGEIKKLMPIFKELRSRHNYEAVLVIPKHFTQENIKDLYGNIANFEVSFDAKEAMLEADFGFICSGTATLEASLVGLPFVLVYVAKPLDFFIAKNLVKLKHIGLANIMFSDFEDSTLHLELIQDSVSVENLQKAMQATNRDLFLSNSKKLRSYLVGGSAINVANIIKRDK